MEIPEPSSSDFSLPSLSIGTNVAVESSPGNPKPFADVRGGDLLVSHHSLDLRNLLFIEGRWAPADTASLAGSFETCHGPLSGKLSLKLGQGPEDVEGEFSLGGGRVDSLGQAHEVCALLFEGLHLGHQVLE